MPRRKTIGRLARLALLWPVLLTGNAVAQQRTPIHPPPRPALDAPSDRTAGPQDSLAAAIRRRLGEARPVPVSPARWERVRSLYAADSYRPLWLSRADRGARAASLAQALAAAHEDGLRPPVPVAMVREAVLAASGGDQRSELLANADVLLTAAFVALGEDLLVGQVDPRMAAQAWHIAPDEPALDSLLARALRLPTIADALASLRPGGEAYAELRQALAAYRRIVVAGGWPRIPGGTALAPGDTAARARIEAIHERLRREGYDGPLATPRAEPSGAAGTAVFDAAIAGSVARFQARHGLRPDSVLGPRTLEAMNVPAEQRLAQIAANLERHRWLPRTTPERHLLVNAAGFHLQGFDGDREILRMRVIVGAPYGGRSTPSFQAAARAVVFRPYWNVPDGIAANEIWPKARRDPGYLARHRYEVVWRDGARRLRQRPGPENALGLMKLDLPNRFNVYLHDTPTKALFCEDVRAFSHGCIRLEQPAALAAWALGWEPERVRRAMEEGEDDRRVELARPFPVRVAYFTAYMENGELHFATDVYRRDPALMPLVASAALPDSASLQTARALTARLQD